MESLTNNIQIMSSVRKSAVSKKTNKEDDKASTKKAPTTDQP